jgi:two-component system, cell cycle sensor histidine kinase and response regulator CckA
MPSKPTYEELKQRVRELEKIALEHKRTAEALKESEERYRQIFNIAPAGIYEVDYRTGKLVKANDAVCEYTGYTHDELLSMNGIDLLTKKSQEKFLNRTIKVLSGVSIKDNVDFEMIRKDGSVLCINISTRYIYEGEDIVGATVVARDITEQKRSNEALQESAEKYRTILESIEDSYLEVDLKGDIQFFNDSFSKMIGCSEDELLGTNNRDYTDESTSKKLFQIFNEIYNTGKNRSGVEWEYIRKDGKRKHVDASISLMKDQNGNAIGFRGVGRDVTGKKLIESELLKAKNFLQNIFDSSLDGIITTDLHGNIEFVSPSAAKLLDYDLKEIVGNKMYSYYENGIEAAKLIMRESTENDELREHEVKLVRRDGKLLNINLSASFLKNETGKKIGTIGIFRDITEKLLLESQWQQVQKMEAIGTLAGGIAHDFNNILMGIQGYVSLMLIDTGSSNSYTENLKEINKYVKSAVDLTKQLLGFAKGGKYEVKTTDLNELIKKHNLMFARTKKEITISEKYEKNLWPVDVDKGQIEQMLLNIYINAWQAMPKGGYIYIQTENTTIDKDYIKLFKFQPGKYVKISISDTGGGIDKSILGRIFDPFFTTKEIGRGTGLGLASAYGIIKNHNGFINVYSEIGEGTTFNIYLPASENKAIEDNELPQVILKGPETILLVDDEDFVIDVVITMLEKMEYRVLTAKNGYEAIELYKQNKNNIDLVILDMIMPDIGGSETYEKLKKINPDIKVLLSSGYSINGKVTRILEQGCDGFIQKPFNMTLLSIKIREILDKE